MICKLSEIKSENKTPIIHNNSASVLNKGEKLFFVGSSYDFSKFIAALATGSDYCGLKIDCSGRVIYRDLFSSDGALAPFLSETFKKINKNDAFESILIHNDDPYHMFIDDEPDNLYKDGDVVILDYAHYPFEISEKDFYKYINNTLAKNPGVTIIFTAKRTLPVFESTAHTIIQTKAKNAYFRGRNFIDFQTTKE